MMKQMLYLIGILFLTSGCQNQANLKYLQKPVTESAFTYYQNALNLFENSSLDSSLLMIDKAIALKNSYAPFFYLKGKIFLFKGINDSALVNFEKALELKSFYPEIWQDVANLNYNYGNYEKAAVYYEKLAEYMPQKEQYIFYIAKCDNRLKKYEVASLKLEDLRRNGYYFDGLYYEMAYSYWYQQIDDKAVFYFDLYMRAHNEELNCYNLLLGLEIYSYDGNKEKMLSVANKGLEICPELPWWRIYRIDYFIEKNNVKAVQLEIAQLENYASKDDSLKHFLGSYFITNREWNKGIDYYNSMNNLKNVSTDELITIINNNQDNSRIKKILETLYQRTKDKKYKEKLSDIDRRSSE